MADFALTVSAAGAVRVLAPAGELDLATGPRVLAEVERLLAPDGPERLVLDLSDVRFMDSSGLRAVLTAERRARDAGRRLALVEGSDPVRHVFEITGMH